MERIRVKTNEDGMAGGHVAFPLFVDLRAGGDALRLKERFNEGRIHATFVVPSGSELADADFIASNEPLGDIKIAGEGYATAWVVSGEVLETQGILRGAFSGAEAEGKTEIGNFARLVTVIGEPDN